MLTLRPATESDCQTIAGFIRELAEYEKLLHECHVTPDLLRTQLFGPRPYAEVTLACLPLTPDPSPLTPPPPTPVGFALYFHNFSTFLAKPGLYLEDLYVQPPHRNKGIGKALLQHLAQLALSRNCGRLEWSVLDWNTPSIAVYQSLGATPMNDWTTYRLTGQALTNLAQRQPPPP